MGSKAKQNHTKTARQISKTDFHFVTCFYRLYDIWMPKMTREFSHNSGTFHILIAS